MNQKIKVLLAVLVFWTALFIIWEWWYSFPKVRITPTVKANSMKEGVDSILQEAISTYLLPSISLAIVKREEVIYLDAFGFENLETKDSLTVDSPILVAYISKVFFALGAASTLKERGVLASDSLHSIGLGKIPNSISLANIRIEGLLLHQSGIRDRSFSEKIISSSKSQNLNEWGMEFLDNLTNYQSDSVTYTYADANYDLLGFLLTTPEDLDLDSLMKAHVFEPSRMLSSTFVSDWPMEGNGPIGYQKTFIWKRIEPKRIKFALLPSPSSGLVTTTKDMSKALTQLLKGENGAYSEALSWLENEDGLPLGFQEIQISGKDWVGHFGGQAGHSSLLIYSRASDTGIFLFSNSRDEKGFRTEVAKQVLSYISQ